MLLLVAVVITPWFLTTLYHAFEEQHLAISKEQENALQLARLISFNQQAIITDSRALLQALSILPEIKDGSPADCRLRLANALVDIHKYANTGVTDVRGALLCDSLATPKPLWFGDRGWFQQAVKSRQFVVSSLIISRTSGKAVIATALPIFDTRGGVKRVIFSSIDIDWFKHLLKQIKLPGLTTVTMMDANGVIVAQRPDAEKYLGKPNPLTPLKKAIRANKEEVPMGRMARSSCLPFIVCWKAPRWAPFTLASLRPCLSCLPKSTVYLQET